jgi:DNA repair protein RecN (Recombination protein N)
MLVELRVRDLGVIDDQTVLLGAGMTALTGETGAGKTLIVEAIDLLLGARADAVLVRPGALEAVVEGRFVNAGGDEVVLGRAVPAAGRSRAYIDGHMATSGALAEVAGGLVDLHGQHAHQSLLAPAVQRAALDAAGHVSLSRVATLKAALRQIAADAIALGGDARARAREIDLLRFQLDELDGAGLDDPDEDDALQQEQSRLADASGLREAAYSLVEVLSADDGVADRLGAALNGLSSDALTDLRDRLHQLLAEVGDVGRDARSAAESFEDDPIRLAAVGERRRVLGDLRRKYGATLQEVIAFRQEARRRLDELESYSQRAAALEASRTATAEALADAEAELGAARRAAAGPLGAAIEARLRQLAMPRARFEVAVGEDPSGSAVTWLLAANPGEPALPLAKVASGGELARTMLAARLVLGDLGPATDLDAGSGTSGDGSPAESGSAAGESRAAATIAAAGRMTRTLIFDEVDAGIGGEAAVAVGAALAALGRHDQVVVVTHLPQVAAVADHHVVVTKGAEGSRTVAHVRSVQGEARVAELSRMLSGRPDSVTARRHAAELLGAKVAGSGGARRHDSPAPPPRPAQPGHATRTRPPSAEATKGG